MARVGQREGERGHDFEGFAEITERRSGADADLSNEVGAMHPS